MVGGEAGDDGIRGVAALAARYSAHRDEPIVDVGLQRARGERRLSVAPIEEAEVQGWLV